MTAGFVGWAALAAACDLRTPEPAAPEVAARFELLENLAGGETRFRAALELENRGPVELPADGWALYFNFLPVPDPDSVTGSVTFERVNGDLRRLAPGPGFEPLPPGARLRVEFASPGWLIKESDAPAGLYLVLGDQAAPARVAPVVDYSIAPLPADRLRRTPEDRVPVPTAASRFRDNQALVPPRSSVPMVPTPVVFESGSERLVLSGRPRVEADAGLEREAAYLEAALSERFGGAPDASLDEAGSGIRLAVGPVRVNGSDRRAGETAYRLRVDRAAGIEIVGTDPAGVFYGIQTLRALLAPEAAPGRAPAIAEVRIEDAPRFAYRGVHLDVARNFQSAATVKKLLELAASYKLNRLHLHLSDDEGWRLAVRGLPELVEVGGRRGHTTTGLDHLPPSFGSGPDPEHSYGSGHYTRAEFVDILRHATGRHVQVVPEIDLPGHARAAIRAMEARTARLTEAGRQREAAELRLRHPEDGSVYRSVQGWDDNVVDVCLPSTYRFVETVADEIVALYAEAGAPLSAIHIGGDEVPEGVWEGSPACRRLLESGDGPRSPADLPGYFLGRVGDILAARGLVAAGWEEIALEPEAAGSHSERRPSAMALRRGFRPYVWNNVWGWGSEDVGYRLANAGFPVVLCNATNLYFDLAYDKHPREPGYAWAGMVDTRKAWELTPLDLYRNATFDRMGNALDAELFARHERLSERGRESIVGVQGQIWGENAKGEAMMEYLAFPKLLGLAERAWSSPPAWAEMSDPRERRRLEREAWSGFAHRLGRFELPRLDRMYGGVAYRLPPPGAVVEDGLLHANVAYPGLDIRYTLDGGEPTSSSRLYQGPAAVGDAVVRLATVDRRGRASRVVLVQDPAAAPEPAAGSSRSRGETGTRPDRAAPR